MPTSVSSSTSSWISSVVTWCEYSDTMDPRMSIHDLIRKYNIPLEWEQRVKESNVPYHNTMRRLFAGETLESALKIPKVEENTTEVSEGVTQCEKCKSWKVTEMSIQIRSRDEGATSFYACSECKYRWKE